MKTVATVLSLALLCGFQDPPDFQAEVKALRSEYQKAQQEYYKLYREAPTPEARKQVKNPAATFLAKFQDLATRAQGTEAAASALLDVVQLAQQVPKKKEDAQKALSTLTGSHVESPQMERLANALRYAGHTLGDEPVRAALAAIRDGSPHARAKAAAIFIQSVQEMDRSEAKARAGFELLKTEFEGTTYAVKADNFLFELDHLQIGKVAPDFETVDEHGVKWKLSDYRGKVTVVDFWGFW